MRVQSVRVKSKYAKLGDLPFGAPFKLGKENGAARMKISLCGFDVPDGKTATVSLSTGSLLLIRNNTNVIPLDAEVKVYEYEEDNV